MQCFLITIDTEGDDSWSKPREITTRNAAFLPRFQELCEVNGFKPTYLTNFEMACSPEFVEFAKDAIKRDKAEVGMHLHAWNSPPIVPLTADDYAYQPYLIEYSSDVMARKVSFLTNLLKETFSTEIVSHRAGRWSFDARYASILVDRGYRVDCSVTPHVSWRHHMGDPNRSGGTDYREFPDHAYHPSVDDLRQEGGSPLLEVPMTIVANSHGFIDAVRSQLPAGSLVQRTMDHVFPRKVQWLRPTGHNLEEMLKIVQSAVRNDRSYIEFMLHSSELMAGGSPRFRKEEDIERLYEHLEELFGIIRGHFVGATLKEFRDQTVGTGRTGVPVPASEVHRTSL